MRVLLRIFAALACLALAGQRPAAAQVRDGRGVAPEDVADVLRQLGSHDLAEVATGAYRAVALHVREAAPLLVPRLREQAALAPTQRSFAVRAALLDALVVLDPEVELPDLLPHAEGPLLPAVVVYLARQPARHAAACLALFQILEPGTRAWRALGNALADVRAPGFAASVLRGLELRLTVRIWTRLPRDGWRDPTGHVPGCGFFRARTEGFPPSVVYRLRDEREEGDLLLVGGPRPVYFARHEHEDGEIWTCSSLERGVPPNAARCEWLASWGALPAGFVDVVAMDLRWTGEQRYVREVCRRRDALVSAWREAVRHLASCGLLTPHDRLPSAPTVRVVPDDRRIRRGEPSLPTIPEPRMARMPLRFAPPAPERTTAPTPRW